MKHRLLRVLLVEDKLGDARLIREMLAEAAGESFHLEHVERLDQAIERLGRVGQPRDRARVDVILLDLSLPDAAGLNTVRRALESAGDVPLVVLTGLPDEDQARRAVQEGAQDYLVKGQVTGDLLSRSLRYAIERGRVEAELRRRAEELSAADRRKDRFLAMLSHELRAPLAPILSATEVMRSVGPLEDSRLEWARDTIARQVRHMAGLLEDLLDLSRITMGKIGIRRRITRLDDLIERALSTTRGRIEKQGQELSVSPSPVPVWLEADPDRIEQVLVNLLNNASAFTDAGGRIWLSTETDGEEVVVRIRDTGIGMEASTLERIFEPFAQESGSAARSEGGLGIGLSLAKTLVELHGGSIGATSPGPGRGSEFEVRLPRLREAPASRSPTVGDSTQNAGAGGGEPDLSGLRVLVVDDHHDTAEGLRLLLSEWGCDVRVVHDGHDALRVAGQWTPAAVLLDIGLPGLDGYQVAKSLRENRGTADTRIVAVSGYGQKRDRERARAVGFDGYLVKPVQPERVREFLGLAPEVKIDHAGALNVEADEAGAGSGGGSSEGGVS